MIAPAQSNVQRKVFLKIGRPGYRVTKVRDRDTGKEGMMVQVHLPQIKADVVPRRRFMSAWEQKREPPNKAYQYLIVRTPSTLFEACILTRLRLPRNLTKPSPSAFQPARSKMRLTTLATGTGRTGTLIQSNIVSSSCSGYNTEHVYFYLYCMSPSTVMLRQVDVLDYYTYLRATFQKPIRCGQPPFAEHEIIETQYSSGAHKTNTQL